MNIVFVSNFLSHHQRPLSDALAKGSHYTFIATEPITQERLAMGWSIDEEPEYVCHYDRELDRVQKVLSQAEVVIVGSAPEYLVRRCIHRNCLVFRYLERPLKNGTEPLKYLPRLLKWHLQNPHNKPIYLLCASAYTAGDYARYFLFRNRAFRWGYFPETKCYDKLDTIMNQKKKASILWCGRFLDWKHPEAAVGAAAKLKAAGYAFSMRMIGTGIQEHNLKQSIKQNHLEDCVHLLGAMKPHEVRSIMEESQIFLFTSDRKEGWGAVLNESMNSGCAVVASDAIGSVPYLIRNGENGLVYHSGDVDELYEKVKYLLDNPLESRCLGERAYIAMTESWNSDVAAQRLLRLAEHILEGKDSSSLFAEGPCSPAEIVREDWYRQ